MPVCKDFVVHCNVGGMSLQRFHFFNGIFLGRWYPEGFHAKSMVLKRFARENRVVRDGRVKGASTNLDRRSLGVDRSGGIFGVIVRSIFPNSTHCKCCGGRWEQG